MALTAPPSFFNSRALVRTKRHCFQRHIRSRRRIHWSSGSIGVQCCEILKYPIKPRIYSLSWAIRSAIETLQLLAVSFLMRCLKSSGGICGSTYSFPREAEAQELYLISFARFTPLSVNLELNILSRNPEIDCFTRSPARGLLTRMMKSSAYLANLCPPAFKLLIKVIKQDVRQERA
jgi:hypothetical protein